MSRTNAPSPDFEPPRGDVSTELLGLMSRDLIFSMKFLGESQFRLQRHFQDFMIAELAAKGVTQDTHPLIHVFVERHAILLRDFVFSGVALSRQFRIEDVERLIGDSSSLLRVDIWDQLRSHVQMAERQFMAQLPNLPAMLAGLEDPSSGGGTGEEAV
ncbi:hypothetical protein LMIY3S_02939 [Labrys miyagiensis]